jgi:hypothetical protein
MINLYGKFGSETVVTVLHESNADSAGALAEACELVRNSSFLRANLSTGVGMINTAHVSRIEIVPWGN